jgi:hypothetical protein
MESALHLKQHSATVYASLPLMLIHCKYTFGVRKLVTLQMIYFCGEMTIGFPYSSLKINLDIFCLLQLV